jgi:hypothetical protein
VAAAVAARRYAHIVVNEHVWVTLVGPSRP